jgi:hypothetical protein
VLLLAKKFKNKKNSKSTKCQGKGKKILKWKVHTTKIFLERLTLLDILDVTFNC